MALAAPEVTRTVAAGIVGAGAGVANGVTGSPVAVVSLTLDAFA